ncbi:hypothetical protein O0I10_003067 [Lichtheimia ornata]|uniref:Uncharacterized protein n=1 Tax=Lichtheimia ornata TaxID=688661 RepID=A0AAD7V967_9FUNG|nr:uncharacterized protein O0I10_003067 [Lichtheimia ornata]KAJ8661317.1 hypothetical protein O0I10_003067 [Lichtheimia ornata]
MSASYDGFWKICDDNGVCHCDWRLTVYGCEEEQHMVPFYIALAAFSGLVGTMAAILGYYRIILLNQTVFDCRTGFPRPKPIESMIVFGTAFNILRMIHAIIMVTDVAPNVAFRSFMFEFPWHFGIGALACYLFGIAHTLSDSNKTVYNRWVRSPIIIDGVCLIFIVGPHFTNNVCSIAAGVYANKQDYVMAEGFTNALYWFWTFYTGCLGILILFAGLRLLRLLTRHLHERQQGQVCIRKVKLGTLKVKIIIVAGSACLTGFAVIMILYAACRIPITKNTAENVAIACVWMFNGVAATAAIFLGIVLNPKLATLAASFGSSSGGGTSANRSHHMSTSSGTNETTTATQSESKWQATQHTSMGSGWTAVDSKPKYSLGDIKDMPEFITSGGETIRSQIDEDQLNYNAMTSIARAPPRNLSSTEDHRYRVAENDTITLSSTTGLNTAMQHNHYY